ncbi:hypothetical protein [Tsukamurella spumae]|uniref:DUF4328 domain-containing protein n=1 Tax=Tsukamurella spumae TaxID=44753 RepID=A0A846WUQ3_9ACTN|nr:hypothetical protein [Tsukamurella spumae]NKY16837.1 hypothetical protein [Tsukamurella spumae]
MLETAIRWVAFFGGWLLVAGPLIQARLELEAEGQELSGIQSLLRATLPPSRLSRWWWLLPPLALYLTRRRQTAYLATLNEKLTPEQRHGLWHFFAVARAWMIVASGAFLIALKETYELAHHHHWPAPAFWGLCVIGIFGVNAANAATWNTPGHRSRA